MPVTRSAAKALRRDRRRMVVNKALRLKVKEAVDAVVKSTLPTQELIDNAFSALDRAAKKHIIHANKAARVKSRLSRLLKSRAVAPKKTTASQVSKPKKSQAVSVVTKKKTVK